LKSRKIATPPDEIISLIKEAEMKQL